MLFLFHGVGLKSDGYPSVDTRLDDGVLFLIQWGKFILGVCSWEVDGSSCEWSTSGKGTEL